MRRVLAAVVVCVGCSRTEQPAPSPGPAAATAIAPSTSVSAPIASAPPPATSSAPAVASSAAPATFEVRSIGMHIGGGPNDDANKAPLLASIAPRHEALGRCWEALPNKPKLEFGIDAEVPAKGGRAKITRPRSTVNDATFIACAVGVFTEIEWLPPKSKIETTVSTSVRISSR
jgi:hypothetical protein